MLAQPDATSLHAAAVTPTQRALHLDHQQRLKRLGVAPARSTAPMLLPRAVAAAPVVPTVKAVAVPQPAPARAEPRDRAGAMDAAAQARAVTILLAAGVPRDDMLAMLGISWSTLSKRIRLAEKVGQARARMRAEAAARIERETAMIDRGLKAGVNVAQLALILDVSNATVRSHIRGAGLVVPGRRTVGRRATPADAELRISMLLATVARQHGVTVELLVGRPRGAKVSAARDEAAHRMFDEIGLPVTRIGKALGGRDHSTISCAIARHRHRKGGAA